MSDALLCSALRALGVQGAFMPPAGCRWNRSSGALRFRGWGAGNWLGEGGLVEGTFSAPPPALWCLEEQGLSQIM